MIKQMIACVAMTGLISFGMLFPAGYAATPQFKTAPATLTIETKPTTTSTAAQTKAAKKAAPVADSTEPVIEGKKLVAHVVWVKGSFTAAEPGSATTRALKKSSNVYMNDTVETGPDSEAQLVFTDNSLMAFRADTKLYINEYNYNPKPKNAEETKSSGRYVMDLITGGFRTITGLVAKQNPDNYQVNTPVATIGVRGTEFSIVYKDGKLYMKQYKGEPCISKKGSSDKEKDTICLNGKNKYAEVPGEGAAPIYLGDAPMVFSVDVEVIPVIFSQNGIGFCGINGCDSGGGPTGFCIQ